MCLKKQAIAGQSLDCDPAPTPSPQELVPLGRDSLMGGEHLF